MGIGEQFGGLCPAAGPLCPARVTSEKRQGQELRSRGGTGRPVSGAGRATRARAKVRKGSGDTPPCCTAHSNVFVIML